MTRRLCVLLTNHFLSARTGSELYVHDVALGLLARGHRPIVYSPTLGPLADKLNAKTVTVVDDLAKLPVVPDVIHAQHSLESLVALLQYPGVPAVYVCHDWNWPYDTPPQLPRIRRYVAVDDTVRDRLLLREGVPEARIEVLFNGIDLNRFTPRGPLPPRLLRALVFSNYIGPPQLAMIRSACANHGIEVDGLGRRLGGERERPEEVLGQYDLVFAKGRCAWESLASGCAVMVCDASGAGPLVTVAELETLHRANFGRRLLQRPLDKTSISEQLARYDAADANGIAPRIRAIAGVDRMIDHLVGLYETVVSEQQQVAVPDHAADLQAAAKFLRHWSMTAKAAASPPPVPALDAEQIRDLVRDELSRQQPVTGLRKLLRSIRKQLPGDFFRRAA